jgi:hypothetical protein
VHALTRTPSPQLPSAERASGNFLLAKRPHPMAEIFPDNIRINIFSEDYLIYYRLITLLVESPDDR